MPEGSSGENLSFNSEQCGSSPVEVFAKQGRSDGGYWGGWLTPPTFLKLTYSEIWVGHSENKGDNRLDSTNEIYLLNRNY